MLEHAPDWCGAGDDDTGFDPAQELVRDLWRRNRGLRIPRTGLITERLIPVILEQKVTGHEARRAYRRLSDALAEAAPGEARTHVAARPGSDRRASVLRVPPVRRRAPPGGRASSDVRAQRVDR